MTDDPLGPIIAYMTGALGLLVILVRALPQLFGPLGRFVTNWTDQRTATRRRAIAVQVADLRDAVEVLQQTSTELRAKARVHAVWDRDVYRILLEHGLADQLGMPPDLF